MLFLYSDNVSLTYGKKRIFQFLILIIKKLFFFFIIYRNGLDILIKLLLPNKYKHATPQMTSSNASDAQVQHLLNTYDWQFVPVVNPDGYVYTWGSDSEVC